jgi:hypothetical protein
MFTDNSNVQISFSLTIIRFFQKVCKIAATAQSPDFQNGWRYECHTPAKVGSKTL